MKKDIVFFITLFSSLLIITIGVMAGQTGNTDNKHSRSGSSKNTDGVTRKIHFETFTIDTHIDIPENFSDLRLNSDNDGIRVV